MERGTSEEEEEKCGGEDNVEVSSTTTAAESGATENTSETWAKAEGIPREDDATSTHCTSSSKGCTSDIGTKSGGLPVTCSKRAGISR